MNKKQLVVICVMGLFLCGFDSTLKKQHDPKAIDKEIKNDYQILAYGTSFFGGIWKKLNKEQKECYLSGFEDGSVDIIARYIPGNKRDEITGELPSFYGLGEDMLIEKLDEFYANIVNLNIPLPLALTIIRADFQGLPYDANTKGLIEFYRKELDSVVKDKVNQ